MPWGSWAPSHGGDGDGVGHADDRGAVGKVTVQVLVVEDDPTTRDVALLMLDRLGHRADTAGTGAVALAMLRAARYDVVLMDVHLPVMDGTEVTRRIRSRLPSTHQPVVVATTASATRAERRSCLMAGMDGVLTKPLSLGRLSDALRWPRSPWGEAPDGASQGATAMAMATTACRLAIFDPAVLDGLVHELGTTGVQLRTDLIDTYLRDDARRLAGVAGAVRATDGGSLAFVAHELRAASATLGLLSLSAAAGRIDDAFRSTPDRLDVAGAAAELAAECRAASRELEAARGDVGLAGETGEPVVGGDVVGRHRPGEVVALVPVAVEARHVPPLLGGLDTFGHDGHAQPVGQGHHGVDDEPADRLAIEVADEGLVDLDDVDGQVLQIAQ